jgi:transcriptional regulator with XRE-family HTH domain
MHRPESRDATNQLFEPPPVRFADILTELINESGYGANRRPVWEAIGVSSAALSQYTLGHTRPKLEVMVALAEFFGVTLDYLITGRESPRPVSDESTSITRYVDFALSDLQNKVGRRAWLTARVGQLLIERVEAAVDEATGVAPGGILSVDDVIKLEHYATAIYVWNVQLEYDVVLLPSGEAAAGRFAAVVASNLMSNPPRPYHFLVHEPPRTSLAEHVRVLRKILRRDFGVSEDRLRFCKFRKTAMPVLIGTCMYELDLPSLQHNEPALALGIADYISPSGEIGFTSLAEDAAQSETLLAADRVSSALTTFRELWRNAEGGL